MPNDLSARAKNIIQIEQPLSQRNTQLQPIQQQEHDLEIDTSRPTSSTRANANANSSAISTERKSQVPSTKSLFDVIEEKYKQEALRTSRIVIIGSCPNPSALSTTQKTIENWLKSDIDQWNEPSPITGGFVTINTSSFILLGESNSSNIQSLLHILHSLSKGGSFNTSSLHSESSSTPIITLNKVLIMNEETLRVFPLFFFQAVQVQHEERTDIPDTTALLSSTFECVRNLLEIGREVRSRYDQHDAEHAQKYINHSSFAKQLTIRSPSEELIKELTLSDEIMDIGDMLELMEAPVDAALEEDLTWPVQPYIQLYPKSHIHQISVDN